MHSSKSTQRIAKISETQNGEAQRKTIITLISPRIWSHFGFRKFLLSAVIMLAAFFSCLVSAHEDGAYYHDNNDLPKRIWMKQLPDYRQLSKISMPGTHDTASFYGGDMTQTQTLKIPQQLNAGIRFLDIRIKHEGNKFEIYHGIAYQHQTFDQVMQDVTSFLKENPSEVVLMRISQAGDEKNNTRSFNDTFVEYAKKYNDFFAYPKDNFNPLLCQVRGKILLYPTENIPILLHWGLKYDQAFDAQDDYHLVSNWDLHQKWEKILAHITKANSSYQANKKIPLNYISGSGGSFPYFVASGHSSPATNASRLVTGLLATASKYPDFPRVGGSILFEGTNTLLKDYLLANSSKLKYVGIVIADFPGAELINAIININPFKFSPDLGDNNKACPPTLAHKATADTKAVGPDLCAQIIKDPKYSEVIKVPIGHWLDSIRKIAFAILANATGIARLNTLSNEELYGILTMDCATMAQKTGAKLLSTPPEQWTDDDRNTAIAVVNNASGIAVGKLQDMTNGDIAILLRGKKK